MFRPETPTGLESVVLRGLAREPAARWPSAAALRDVLAEEADRLGVEIGALENETPQIGGALENGTPQIGTLGIATGGPTADPGSSTDPIIMEESPDRVRRTRAERMGRGVRRVLGALAFTAIAVLGVSLVVSAGDIAGHARLL